MCHCNFFLVTRGLKSNISEEQISTDRGAFNSSISNRYNILSAYVGYCFNRSYFNCRFLNFVAGEEGL